MDYRKAHAFSNNNKSALENPQSCGCFYCGKMFDSTEIMEWIEADNSCDYKGTAICPYCGIDAVIGESSGIPITREFLEGMNRTWF